MKPTVIVLADNFAAVRDAVTGPMLMQAAFAGGHVVEAHAKVNAGSGRPGLQIQSGALVGSINTKTERMTKTRATVAIGPTVLYARIHEYGGVIVPRNAPMLSWINNQGERVFANAVHIPARPYMRPAVDMNKQSIADAVGMAIISEIMRAAP